MAIPLRQPSAAPVRRAEQRLAVVPVRRRIAWFAVAVTVLISIVMMTAVFLHTRIAERQLEIDRLEQAVRQSQEDFDILRAQRAELRSPTRIATQARELGMLPGAESEYVSVDPMIVAMVIAQTGQIPGSLDIESGINARLEPLDQFRLVKTVGAEAP
jgi:cell division protein FtsL